jgi:adenosine kinase
MDIIVTGSLAFDQIMIYPGSFAENIMPDKLHILSVSFITEELHKNFGGTAGNICYNLGIMGKHPICLATVGKDADDYKAFLSKNGVDIDDIATIADEYTASFVVITDKKDCQIAGFYEGAMKHDKSLSIKETVKRRKIDVDEAYVVIAPTSPEAMKKNVQDCKELGVRYLYAPAQQIAHMDKKDIVEGLNSCEILIGNDYEIAQIEKKCGLTKTAMLEKIQVVVTTLGEKGSLIEQKGKEKMIVGVAKPREVKDPTGVGDAYIAGFLSSYLDGKPIPECGQRAATAAVYTVEKYGTTGHSFSKDLFENRWKENFS